MGSAAYAFRPMPAADPVDTPDGRVPLLVRDA